MTVVSVENLRVEVVQGSTDIVDEVSFAIDAGEIHGLVGESGSGKTTVGLALLGHARRGARIAGGVVRIGDVDMVSASEDAVRALRGRVVSYVPQDPAAALNPAMRISTQLHEVLEVHSYGDSRAMSQRIGEMLSEVLLPTSRSFLRRYPHQLSGGQQQRVALAMAFACRPRVIVLDEPTTGLDVTTQAHVLETIRDLCAAHGVAALYVSHDLAVVAGLASLSAVMYAGRIVERGPTRELLRAPGHPYTQCLVDAIPRMAATGSPIGLPGSAPRPGRRPVGCTFAARCPHRVDVCTSTTPDLRELSFAHEVRCLRADELASTTRVAFRGTAADPRAVPRGTPTDMALDSTALLEVQGVQASHGQRQVVFDVNIRLGSHESVAIVGESGSGKTTLAQSIAGLHTSWSGTVALHGQPLAKSARDRPRAARREIQYIFQDPYSSLNPRKTVWQSLAQPCRLFHRSTAVVSEALEQVSLDSAVATRYPDQLSGGERQRVVIARALIAEPSLLICDEITSALDVSVQASIVTLLRRLQRELGVGLLFITHNLSLVPHVSERVVVMTNGKIVEEGDTRTILTAPQADYTKRLTADTPDLDAALALA